MFDKPFVFISHNNVLFKVDLDSIIYLEADGSYCSLITTTKTYQVSANIKKLLSNLNSPLFFRISRQHVVNLYHIVSINGSTLKIIGKDLHISRNQKQDLLKKYYIMNSRDQSESDDV